MTHDNLESPIVPFRDRTDAEKEAIFAAAVEVFRTRHTHAAFAAWHQLANAIYGPTSKESLATIPAIASLQHVMASFLMRRGGWTKTAEKFMSATGGDAERNRGSDAMTEEKFTIETIRKFIRFHHNFSRRPPLEEMVLEPTCLVPIHFATAVAGKELLEKYRRLRNDALQTVIDDAVVNAPKVESDPTPIEIEPFTVDGVRPVTMQRIELELDHDE